MDKSEFQKIWEGELNNMTESANKGLANSAKILDKVLSIPREINIMLDPWGKMPTRAHATDAGMDVYAPHRVVVFPKTHEKVGTGVHLEIPEGYAAFVKSKSGLMTQGILVDGTIDSGYTGEIGVIIFNLSNNVKIFERGEKIAQIVIQEAYTPNLKLVDSFKETERGDGGFGSTGR